MKIILVYSVRVEIGGQSVALFDLSWEHVSWKLSLSLSAHVQK